MYKRIRINTLGLNLISLRARVYARVRVIMNNDARMCVRVWVYACVRACVCVCVWVSPRVCARIYARVRVWVRARMACVNWVSALPTIPALLKKRGLDTLTGYAVIPEKKGISHFDRF